MSITIRADVQELENIDLELKRLNKRRKELLDLKKIKEEKIQEYLRERNLPGVKHHDTAVVLKEKDARARKKPKESDADSVAVLERYGVNDPERVLKEILDSRKGDPYKKAKIIFSRIKAK